MRNKRGQATVFVIIALVLVALMVLFFLLWSYVIPKTTISPTPNAPNQYLAECVSEQIGEASKLIIDNNGYISKDRYKESMAYEYEKIPYLCYTEESYARCIAQEPVLISHLNEEVYAYIEDKIDECFNSLKSDIESDGFSLLSEGQTSFEVELMPNNIKVKINKNLKFSKAEESKEFNTFTVNSVSPLYDMALIVQRIIKEESLWTNSGYIDIMEANRGIDINKFTTGSDDEIYTVLDKKTESSWRFAVRGGILPTPK